MVTAAPPGIVASVIIPTRGGANRLPWLLESLDRQRRRDFEVIVVVDVDGTKQLLDDCMSAHPEVTPSSITFLQNSVRAENHGSDRQKLGAGRHRAPGAGTPPVLTAT